MSRADELASFVRALLDPDQYAGHVTPSVREAARKALAGHPPGGGNAPRLHALTGTRGDIDALLIQSIAVTHCDCLDLEVTTIEIRDGARAITGRFRHLPTAETHYVSVVSYPSTGG